MSLTWRVTDFICRDLTNGCHLRQENSVVATVSTGLRHVCDMKGGALESLFSGERFLTRL